MNLWSFSSSVGWELLCPTHILSLKCLRLPVTKKWRATPNVKILVLRHPLGDFAELIWFGSRSSLSRLKPEDRRPTLEIGATVVKPTDVVRDLGVLLDSELTMKRHVSKMVSTCFYHLRRLRWAAPTPREHWYHKAAGVRLHLQSTRLL